MLYKDNNHFGTWMCN